MPRYLCPQGSGRQLPGGRVLPRSQETFTWLGPRGGCPGLLGAGTQQVCPHPGALELQVASHHVQPWLGAGLQGQVPALLCLWVDDHPRWSLLCKTGARKRHHSLPDCGWAPRDKRAAGLTTRDCWGPLPERLWRSKTEAQWLKSGLQGGFLTPGPTSSRASPRCPSWGENLCSLQLTGL